MTNITRTLLGQKIIVGENQIALMFRNQTFEKVLPAGKHFVSDWASEVVVNIFDATQLYFNHAEADLLIKRYAEVASLLHSWRVAVDEVGLLYLDNQLKGVVMPGEKLYLFKAAGDLRLDKIKLNDELALKRPLLDEIKHRGLNSMLKLIIMR